MKTIKNNAQAYKAPVCKMVEVSLQSRILQGSNGSFQINRWEEDEEELSC